MGGDAPVLGRTQILIDRNHGKAPVSDAKDKRAGAKNVPQGKVNATANPATA
jgi:hypothetical protein